MILLLALLLAPLPALAAPEPGSWAVVGLREAGAPPIGPTVELLRGAAALELKGRAGSRILDGDETRARLGLPSARLPQVKEWIDSAELYYFQLELKPARENLERALAALAHLGGDPQAYERTRMARLLLSMVSLAEKGKGSRERAREQLELLVAEKPDYAPNPQAYPKELLELFEEARVRVAKAPRGRLKVTCRVAAACKDGHVWVDTVPLGLPGETISLPQGSYRVAVTDRFEHPTVRSLTREIELQAGEELAVEVDLGVEGAVDPADGPAFLLPRDGTARTAAAVLAARHAGAERLVSVQTIAAGDARRLYVTVVEAATGKVEREAHVRITEAAPLSSAVGKLAHFAVAGEARDGVVEPSAATAPAAAEERPDPAPAAGEPAPDAAVTAEEGPPLRPLQVAKWSTTAATVVLAGLGAWFEYAAVTEDDAAAAQLQAWGGTVRAGEEASFKQRIDQIDSDSNTAIGLLVGAGLTAATSGVLFFLDAEP